MPLQTGCFPATAFFLALFAFVKYQNFGVRANPGSLFIRSKNDLKASNPYILQTQFVSWEGKPGQCLKKRKKSTASLDRLVIRFDKQSGKCERYVNTGDCLLATDTPDKSDVFYTGINPRFLNFRQFYFIYI